MSPLQAPAFKKKNQGSLLALIHPKLSLGICSQFPQPPRDVLEAKELSVIHILVATLSKKLDDLFQWFHADVKEHIG